MTPSPSVAHVKPRRVAQVLCVQSAGCEASPRNLVLPVLVVEQAVCRLVDFDSDIIHTESLQGVGAVVNGGNPEPSIHRPGTNANPRTEP